MKFFTLMAVVAMGGAAHAGDVRLLPQTEGGVWRHLIDEQPTFSKSVTMMVVGSSVATVGATCAIVGTYLALMPVASALAGIGIFIGAVLAGVGGAQFIFGVLMAVHGGRNLRFHYRVNEALEQARAGRATPDTAMATLASF